MLIHKSPHFSIYFGNAQDQLYPEHYLASPSNAQLLLQSPYAQLQKAIAIKNLYFARQIHSIKGYKTEDGILPAFAHEGDYLVTSTKSIGIGVMTADCLPIVLCDPHQPLLAIVHAGWKGSVHGILHQVVPLFTNKKSLQVFFGPSAGVCCYQVQPDFQASIPLNLHNAVFKMQASKFFFNLSEYNRLTLIDYGIPQSAIHTHYNYCTLCDLRFFSHRRQA